ncbi:MAG TPA: hypothetical protein VMA37_06925 [Acetobacteraceae bacterium]|nr:hypothetical protein [Acetobacteraceae bacterium]
MRRALLAATACCALAGISAPAMAKSPSVHTMTIQLPSGEIAQVRYTGDAPPAVVIAPGPMAADAFMPALPMFGPNSPFAVMDRISAQMDQQAASLLHQVESLAAAPLDTSGSLPPGTSGYSFVSTTTGVSTMTGNGACMESTQITYSGNSTPKVVSYRSGDCGVGAGTAAPMMIRAVPTTPARPQAQPPRTILASDN